MSPSRFFSSPAVLAGLPALLLAAAVAAPAMAQPLGRLFSSPLERAQLDARRDGATSPEPPAAAATEPAPGAAGGAAPSAPAQQLVLNGLVRRSNGKSTVWLNEAAQNDERNDLARAGAGATALTVRLPSGKRVLLRAGQRYDTGDGRVKEVHEP
ncbi:hypothetical protein [Rugamonas sp. DEMB1]|uniref:hypothetical protein n=1 Tax=Rugamonas sp. DEMB1 TaxID=3039386 RepID=UPI002449A069|nr:hypothetical protein [Rugamonas sp. DEMB1]WGG52668.1 hypothetical protein QC826_11270 [Rugamonas sp. DEMB1]